MNSGEGFRYIKGDQEQSCYQMGQNCCGNIVGCFKAWCPCIGCFCCCCNSPYVQVQQGKKGLLLKYQKYIGTVDPGLIYINPITQSIITVDCRISVLDMPNQRLLTKDNITITIDSCVYYHIQNPHLAHFRMNNVVQSVTKITGGIIKNTVAQFTFQELLEKREEIANDIEMQIEPITRHWGVDVDKIFLKGKYRFRYQPVVVEVAGVSAHRQAQCLEQDNQRPGRRVGSQVVEQPLKDPRLQNRHPSSLPLNHKIPKPQRQEQDHVLLLHVIFFLLSNSHDFIHNNITPIVSQLINKVKTKTEDQSSIKQQVNHSIISSAVNSQSYLRLERELDYGWETRRAMRYQRVGWSMSMPRLLNIYKNLSFLITPPGHTVFIISCMLQQYSLLIYLHFYSHLSTSGTSNSPTNVFIIDFTIALSSQFSQWQQTNSHALQSSIRQRLRRWASYQESQKGWRVRIWLAYFIVMSSGSYLLLDEKYYFIQLAVFPCAIILYLINSPKCSTSPCSTFLHFFPSFVHFLLALLNSPLLFPLSSTLLSSSLLLFIDKNDKSLFRNYQL